MMFSGNYVSVTKYLHKHSRTSSKVTVYKGGRDTLQKVDIRVRYGLDPLFQSL